MSEKTVGVLSQISFKFKVTVAICLVLAVILLFTLFIILPDYRNELRFLTALLGGAAMVYAGYYAGATLRINLARDKQHRGSEIIQSLNNIDMASIRVFIEKEINTKEISQQDLYDKILNDPVVLSRITVILGFFEYVSIAIQEDYADEVFLYKSLGFLVPWTFYSLNSYIKEERTRLDESALYIELEKLADAWKKKTSLLTGKSLPPLV
ncbi:MAG: DUF4760 domain-containing protein [Methanophagales archaeon]|nr:DUF4760 domain-containing protein [Methanophagales archaeon]